MASTIVLKRRIASIKSTRQITKALQLVAASKMRRAQEYAFRSRAYRDLAFDLLRKLSNIQEVEQTTWFHQRSLKNRLYIVITSDSGLAGAYNANAIKLFARAAREDEANGIGIKAIVIGNKGIQFARRLQGVELVGVYHDFGDEPTANDVRPILTTLMDSYADESVDSVALIYTMFRSNISQEAQRVELLPASKLPTEQAPDQAAITTFEPDAASVISEITTRLVEAQLWQAILESNASFHSMRMLAMKNATDNAKDLIDDYTLELNTARQAAITQELAEITGGAEALNG